jgi:hypothetical protein
VNDEVSDVMVNCGKKNSTNGTEHSYLALFSQGYKCGYFHKWNNSHLHLKLAHDVLNILVNG